MKSKIFNGTIA